MNRCATIAVGRVAEGQSPQPGQGGRCKIGKPMPDEPGRKFVKRESNLTEQDIEKISLVVSSIVESVLHNKDANRPPHDCRFANIEPKDLTDMVNTFKKFDAAMDDSKTVVRRFVLVLVLTGLSGLTLIGYWTKITDLAKKAISGGN